MTELATINYAIDIPTHIGLEHILNKCTEYICDHKNRNMLVLIGDSIMHYKLRAHTLKCNIPYFGKFSVKKYFRLDYFKHRNIRNILCFPKI